MTRVAAVIAAALFAALVICKATPADAVPYQLLGGVLGSAVGWATGLFTGRAVAAAFGAESQAVVKDLITLATLSITVTGGTCLGVMGASSLRGVVGDGLACAGGAILGMIVGMAVEPIVSSITRALLPDHSPPPQTLTTLVEVVGFAALVLTPSIGGTIGFNFGVSER